MSDICDVGRIKMNGAKIMCECVFCHKEQIHFQEQFFDSEIVI